MKWGDKDSSTLLIAIVGLLAVGSLVILTYAMTLRAENKQLIEVLTKEKQLENILYIKAIDFEKELKQMGRDVHVLRLGKCPDKYGKKKEQQCSPIVLQQKKADKRKGNGGYLIKNDTLNP